jgi:hypothetical protein
VVGRREHTGGAYAAHAVSIPHLLLIPVEARASTWCLHRFQHVTPRLFSQIVRRSEQGQPHVYTGLQFYTTNKTRLIACRTLVVFLLLTIAVCGREALCFFC